MRKLEGLYDANLTLDRWQSVEPPNAIGFDYLVSRARLGGYDNAREEFDADGEAPPAIIALPTEGERIAALVGLAARAFLLELPCMSDGELKSRWAAIRAAASANDPLKQYFYSTVIQHASLLRDPDAERFQIVLDARLRDKDATGAWRGYSVDERRLLLSCVTRALRHAGCSCQLGHRLGGRTCATPRTCRGTIWSPGTSRRAPWSRSSAHQARGNLSSRSSWRPESRRRQNSMRWASRRRSASSTPMSGMARSCISRARAFRGGEGGPARGWRATVARIICTCSPACPHSLISGAPCPTCSTPLSPVEHFDAPPVALIVIDVLRAAIHGDENSSDVMGAAMTTAGAISRMFNAAVLLVHHAPHSDPERARGSTAFGAAMDWIGAVTKRDDEISLTVTKNKDGPDRQSFRWQLGAGPVLESAAAAAVVEHAIGEACALAAAHAIRSIASSGVAVAKRDLSDELKTSHPHLFAPDGMPAASVCSRLSRAINAAIKAGWITEKGVKLSPGAIEPPLLLGGLSDLIG